MSTELAVDQVEGIVRNIGFVADMVSATDIFLGDTLDTMGYYSFSDGGQNRYKIVAAGTGTHDGGQYIDLTGSGLQAQGQLTEEIFVKQWGALAGNMESDEAVNNVALQAAFTYAAANQMWVNVQGGPYRYNTGLNTTNYQHLLIKGDTTDDAKAAEYDLYFTGTGEGVKGKGVTLSYFGLLCGAHKDDPIVVGRHGVRVTNGSITAHESWVSNADKAYSIGAGYYHDFSKGGVRRSRTCYDYDTDISTFNMFIDSIHTGFDVGVRVNGGAGPLVLGGSWELFTTAIVATGDFEPLFPIIMSGLYCESGRGTATVHPNLTGNDADTYGATRMMLLSRQPVSGTFTSESNDLFTKIFEYSFSPEYIDVEGIHEQAGASTVCFTVANPSPNATSLSINVKARGIPENFTATNVLAGYAGGNYFDGRTLSIQTMSNGDDNFSDSWVTEASVDKGILSYKDAGGLVTTLFRLDGSSASSNSVFTMDEGLRPQEVVTTVVSGGLATIGTNGAVTCTSRDASIYGSVTYQARSLPAGAVLTNTITVGGAFVSSNATHNFTQASTSGTGTGLQGTAKIAGDTVTQITYILPPAVLPTQGQGYVAGDTVVLDIPTATQTTACTLTIDTVVS